MYLKSGSRLTCFLMFLHFLQKYRCVPEIAFSADISIDIFIDISIDMFIDIYIESLVGISIDTFIEIYIDIFVDVVGFKCFSAGLKMRFKAGGPAGPASLDS